MQRNIYIDNINRDEMRSGFLVTSKRKKLWNVQLNLLVEFERVCQKNGVKWFAACGTLLGAVRHKGFVPWDDDVDTALTRPEYEKLKKCLFDDFDERYFVDAWYNYAQEGEPNPENLTVIKREHLDKYPWLPFSPFMKLRDLNTTYLKYLDIEYINQGIWVDIFPFDPVPPFDNPEHQKIFDRGEEIRRTILYPKQVQQEMAEGKPMLNSYEDLKELIALPTFKERALVYEKYLADNYFESKYVGVITFHQLAKGMMSHIEAVLQKDHEGGTTVLPFENIEVVAPANYESVLQHYYGDWRTPRRSGKSHAKIYSADVSYKEYFAVQTRGL